MIGILTMARLDSNEPSPQAGAQSEPKDRLAPCDVAEPPPVSRWFRRQGGMILICLALLVLVTWAYLPSLNNGFVEYDDDVYVTANEHVQKGITWQNLQWAFANVDAGFWHPLTWLSHMLDVELCGLRPMGHHATNLMLHLANTLLVFLVLKRLTTMIWASAWVAAMFGVHPLHVESVAWVAERKDLLSTFFCLLALWGYTRYVDNCEVRCPKSEVSERLTLNLQHSTSNGPLEAFVTSHASFLYGLTLGCFALGLMSKPMVVTLPLLLLLLDWWPLERMQKAEGGMQNAGTKRPSSLPWLLWEKVPFFALAGVVTLITLYAEKRYGAVSHAAGPPIEWRVANGLVSYVRYLGKTFWPVDLAVFYPYPESFPLWPALVSGMFLVVAIILVITLRRQPSYAVGWFWYLLTLLPVIGLIQVGSHAMADRYTYLPLIGVFTLMAWSASELTQRWRSRTILRSVVGGVTILLCIPLTRQQTRHWKDGETLFRHAVAATRNNPMVNYNWGVALFNRGRCAEAVGQFQEALRLKPSDADAHYNLGVTFGRLGRLDEAIAQLEATLKLRPDLADAHFNLAVALRGKGRLAEAILHFQEALRLKPGYVEAQSNLSSTLDLKKASTNQPQINTDEPR